MQLTIQINMDNAAFEDEDGEIVSILREIIYDFQHIGVMPSRKNLKDINGNTVGFVAIEET